MTSTETDLGQDSLAREQLGAKANHKSEHGKTAIPGLSKFNKTKASRRLCHVFFRVIELIDCHVQKLPIAAWPLGPYFAWACYCH